MKTRAPSAYGANFGHHAEPTLGEDLCAGTVGVGKDKRICDPIDGEHCRRQNSFVLVNALEDHRHRPGSILSRRGGA